MGFCGSNAGRSRAKVRSEHAALDGQLVLGGVTLASRGLKPGALEAHTSTVAALTRALENAGIQFIDENGGGPGVRLRKRPRPNKSK